MKSTSTPLRLTIIDYGMGNVRSVQCAFERLGVEAKISSQPQSLAESDALILPGVGAFGEAMENLRTRGLIDALNEEVLGQKKPILGICLGMQLFAQESFEQGRHLGLGWIPGEVALIDVQKQRLSLPHVGWNTTQFRGVPELSQRLGEEPHFYFDHSYVFRCSSEYVIATSDYGVPVVAGVRRNGIIGFQFHPEKSQTTGLKLLRNFLRLAAQEPRNAPC